MDDLTLPDALAGRLFGGLMGQGLWPFVLDFTLRFEAGYVDHPDDPGGPTNRGITLATLRDWRAEIAREAALKAGQSAQQADRAGRIAASRVTRADVQALTLSDVAPIYEERYWARARCGDLPAALALAVFDVAVMSGPRQAQKTLQRAIAAAGGVALVIDGVIGPMTLRTLSAVVERIGLEPVLREFGWLRATWLQRLRHFAVFGGGWTRRLHAMLAAAARLALWQALKPDAFARG